MAENAAPDGFGANFSGAVFCLPHQMVGILLGLSITAFHGGMCNDDFIVNSLPDSNCQIILKVGRYLAKLLKK